MADQDAQDHEHPGQAAAAAFFQLPSQTGNEVTTVDVVTKDCATFDPTQQDVVADPSAIPASHPCHEVPGTGSPSGGGTEI